MGLPGKHVENPRMHALALLLAALVQDAPPAPYVAATTGDAVRVRAGPSANYRVLERLPRGAWVVVTGTEGEFCRVRVPGGVPVFVSSDLVQVNADGTAEVAKTDVLMRATAGKEYVPLEGQTLQTGDRLTVLGKETGESGEWLRVLPPGHVEYFVHGSLLERLGDEAEKTEDLARIALERRDAYTGGKEAEAAREAARAREETFAKAVESAGAALTSAPGDALPDDAAAQRDALREVMTEAEDPAVRAGAVSLTRDYLLRERLVEIARVKAEKDAVRGELEARLAAAEARYRAEVDALTKVTPARAQRKFLAVGVLRSGLDGYELVKGEVVLHRVDSLRYDLGDFAGKRVGVNGRRIEVDPKKRVTLLHVDALEILE